MKQTIYCTTIDNVKQYVKNNTIQGLRLNSFSEENEVRNLQQLCTSVLHDVLHINFFYDKYKLNLFQI
jgi:hypothetical protein